jgi:predicted nucleotidyltransferase
MKFGLKNEVMENIRSVFARYPQIVKAVIYGSRAKGSFKNGSDIDLALEGNGLDLALLNRVRGDLDSLMLPWSMDICALNQIDNPDLIDHIKRVGAVFYEKSKGQGKP